ncbi:hypothetical protein RB595_000295 [Gaeumannomyces hyphopodioides]
MHRPPVRICATCLRRLAAPAANHPPFPTPRSYSSKPQRRPDAAAPDPPSPPRQPPSDAPTLPAEQGAMSRRLEEATEDALLTGGRAGRRAVEDAGFSAELKARLLEKIAAAGPSHSDPTTSGISSAISSLPASAGRGARHLASSQPWTGEERPADALLRMLGDAHKPLAPELRRPAPGGAGALLDLRPRRSTAVQPGERVSAARERAAAYAGAAGLDAEQRAELRAELRERFTAGARAVMPNSVSGLAALANERIEDAIARGQFRDIPRGRDAAPRDARADNPFVDTTEYIMNKMIRRQDMVPPWIEKQQELAKALRVFRARLRNDWTRHAARSIAGMGGSLEGQVARAEGYAAAERRWNPRRGKVDKPSAASSTRKAQDPVIAKMRKELGDEAVQEAPGEGPAPSAVGTVGSEAGKGEEEPAVWIAPHPFRDPAWEAAEKAYMELAVSNLNSIARSYNLMAPDLAKKPYFTLQRELNACFADVAPLLADTIRERARPPQRPPLQRPPLGGGPGGSQKGVLARLGGEEWESKARVYDSKAPHYGFKEMWRDLFAKWS